MGEVIHKEFLFTEIKNENEKEREILREIGLYPYEKNPPYGYHEIDIMESDEE